MQRLHRITPVKPVLSIILRVASRASLSAGVESRTAVTSHRSPMMTVFTTPTQWRACSYQLMLSWPTLWPRTRCYQSSVLYSALQNNTLSISSANVTAGRCKCRSGNWQTELWHFTRHLLISKLIARVCCEICDCRLRRGVRFSFSRSLR